MTPAQKELAAVEAAHATHVEHEACAASERARDSATRLRRATLLGVAKPQRPVSPGAYLVVTRER